VAARIISLSAAGHRLRGFHTVDLCWTGANAANMDIYRDGALIVTVLNTGSYTGFIGAYGGNVHYTHRVCQAGSSTCSNDVTVRFGGSPL
jgi:hypothetical protein